MICPKCGMEYSEDEKFCYNCGTELITKTNINGKQQQKERKSFYPILFVILLAVVIIILWNPIYHIVLNPQPASTPSPQFTIPTPQPTKTDTYKLNEPATDGNLQITLLESREGDRTEGNNKELYVDLKIDNLRSDKTIQILTEDFLFINSVGQRYPSNEYDFTHRITVTELGGSLLGCSVEYLHNPCNLYPGESQTYDVKGIVPQNSQGLKLRFNYGGPSGKGSNGPFVYFNVNPNLIPTPTLIPTTIPPTPTASPKHGIFDGYWCRFDTWDIIQNETTRYQQQNVKTCYQFFPDGSYTIGNSLHGGGMSKICEASQIVGGKTPCKYDMWKINAQGQYEITGRTFTYYGDRLVTPEEPNQPYFWNPQGV